MYSDFELLQEEIHGGTSFFLIAQVLEAITMAKEEME